MNIREMRKFATTNKINLKGATKKSEIQQILNDWEKNPQQFVKVPKQKPEPKSRQKVEKLTKQGIDKLQDKFDKLKKTGQVDFADINKMIYANNELMRQTNENYKKLIQKAGDNKKQIDRLTKQKNVYINNAIRNRTTIKTSIKNNQKEFLTFDEEFEPQEITTNINFKDSFGGLIRKGYNSEGAQNIQDLYQTFKKVKSEEGVKNIYLQMLIKSGNKNRFITIKPKFLLSFDAFIDRVTQITSGLSHGSDAVDIEEDDIDFNNFQIMYKQRIFGKKQKTKQSDIFKTQEIINTDERCIYHSLKALNCLSDSRLKMFENQTSKAFTEEQQAILWTCDIIVVEKAEDLIGYVKYNEGELFDEWVLCEQYKYLFISEQEKNHHCEPLKSIKIYIDEKENIVDKNENILIKYNRLKEIISDNIKFNQNTELLPMDLKPTTIYFKEFSEEKVKEFKKINEDYVQINKAESRLVIYDIETVFNKQTFKIEPVTLQYMILDHREDSISDLYKSYLKNGSSDSIGYFMGKNCVNDFVELIKKIQPNFKFTFCAYNGASFDSFILYEYFNKQDMIDRNSVVIANNQILQMSINGRHKIHDLCKILNCPLSNACKSFKCEFVKKDQKNFFQVIQNNIMSDKPWDSLDEQTMKDFIEYGIFDILALGELYIQLEKIMNQMSARFLEQFEPEKYHQIEDISEVRFVDITEVLTIGSYVYDKMKQYKTNDADFHGLNIDEFKFVKSAQVAGRTQVYIQGKIQGKYVVVDVCSLYPFVCLNRYFPCGEILHDVTFDKDDERIGFFQLKNIDQTNLPRKILPKRKSDFSLDWEVQDGIIEEMVVDTIAIKQLLKYECKFEIVDCEKNFYFSELIHGSELFKTLKVGKQIKQEQDILKASKSSSYNGALREFAKLNINAISGKVTEGLHCEQTKIAMCEKQVLDLVSKYDDVTITNSIDGQHFVQYTKTEEEVNESMKRPVYLGNLIYSYAREYMFDTCIYENDSISYQDTDSAFISYNDYKKFIKRLPNLQLNQCVQNTLTKQDYEDFVKYHPQIVNQTQKEFGDFEVEAVLDSGAYLQKKCYFCFDGEKLVKKGFKGVKLSGEYQGRLYSKQELEKITIDENPLFRFRNDKCKISNKIKDVEKINLKLYELYFNEQHKIEKNIKQFINDQTNNQISYVVCGSLQKQIKGTNSKNSVSLYQQILIKNINIKQ